MVKASIGVRFGALLLDNIFINIINIIILAYSPYLYFITWPFLSFFYYGICEGSSMSASLGKKICGLVVVDENGNKLSSGKGFTRSICRLVSSALMGIGFIMALFDKDGKALHDKMAGTFVTTEASYTKPTILSNISVDADIKPVATAYKPVPSGIKPEVICIMGQFAGRSFPVDQKGITIGRDKNLCELSYPENTNGISRIHCKVQFNLQTHMFVLYDLGSTYGTYLENGSRIMQDQPVALMSGEGFYLASQANYFRVKI